MAIQIFACTLQQQIQPSLLENNSIINKTNQHIRDHVLENEWNLYQRYKDAYRYPETGRCETFISITVVFALYISAYFSCAFFKLPMETHSIFYMGL